MDKTTKKSLKDKVNTKTQKEEYKKILDLDKQMDKQLKNKSK